MDFTIGKIKTQIEEMKKFYDEIDILFIGENDLSNEEALERYKNIVKEHIYYVNYMYEIKENNEENIIDKPLIETREFLKEGFDFAIKYQKNLIDLQELYEKFNKETKLVKNQSHILIIIFIVLIGLSARFGIFGIYFAIFNCIIASVFISGLNMYFAKVLNRSESTKKKQNNQIKDLGMIIIEIDKALGKCDEILDINNELTYNEK